MIQRCDWAHNEILSQYHDQEWGVPLHDDQKLFEFLILDGMQSGLSWSIILQKRKAFSHAFKNFDAASISKFTYLDINKLLLNKGIIRNKKKILSAINNSKCFIEIKNEFGTFDSYIWSFVNHKTITNHYRKWSEIPSSSKESFEMSNDMKKRGFSFVGPTICYAFMQTVGMVNDHTLHCFRHKELNKKNPES